jgi:dCMP deaminase
MLDKWDHRFLDLAKYISNWSKDPSTKVGAVVAHPKTHRVISVGFNGFPAGVKDTVDRLEDRSVKYEMIAHAEQNALLFAGHQAEGGTIYVSSLAPCARCAVIIIQSGIKRVVSCAPDFNHDRWGDQAKLAKAMFDEAKLVWDYPED